MDAIAAGGCPNSRQHKSRKAVSRSLRLLTVSLYHFYRGLSRVKINIYHHLYGHQSSICCGFPDRF